jgi:hypothetical protein
VSNGVKLFRFHESRFQKLGLYRKQNGFLPLRTHQDMKSPPNKPQLARLKVPECVVMEAQMIFDECAYKKIAVIVALAHGDPCPVVRCLTGGDEAFDLQLPGQEFIRIPLVDQQGQMLGGPRGFDQ